jgi:hypothetical protein
MGTGGMLLGKAGVMRPMMRGHRPALSGGWLAKYSSAQGVLEVALFAEAVAFVRLSTLSFTPALCGR